MNFPRLLLLLNSFEKDYCICVSDDRLRQVKIEVARGNMKYIDYVSYSELIDFSSIEVILKNAREFFRIKEEAKEWTLKFA